MHQCLRGLVISLLLAPLVAGAALGNPTGKNPSGGLKESYTGEDSAANGVYDTRVPLKGFTYMLTFNEVVQATGSGSMTLKEIPDVVDGTTVTKSVSCAASGLSIVDKYVFVPVTTELKAGVTSASGEEYGLGIPSTCFKNTGGEVLASNIAETANKFRVLTKPTGTVYTGRDETSPQLYAQPAASNTPVRPFANSWVDPTKATEYSLYFREEVQAGESTIQITKTGTSGTLKADTTGGLTMTTALDPIATSDAKVTYSSSVPGLVTVKPPQFDAGAEYGFVINTAAFKDAAGNFNFANTITAAYKVYVTTSISKYYPSNGATKNITKYTNLLLEFAHEVTEGAQSGFTLCSDWSASDACKKTTSVPLGNMFFLGKKVLINPSAALKSNQLYNVSIGSDTIKYFKGLSADAERAWTYKFTTEPSTASDRAKPELVGSFIDCDADGSLDGDTCDMDGDTKHDFVELTDSVSASTPVGPGAAGSTMPKFKLYFKEPITVVSAKTAMITADDGSAAVAVTTTVAGGSKDCIVTMSPSLDEGKLYTLSLGSDVITDSSVPYKNPYDGTTFSFYRPLKAPTNANIKPTPAATNIAKSDSLKMTFGQPPRLGLDAANHNINVYETSATPSVQTTLSLSDKDVTKIQGNDVLVIQNPMFKPGKSYTVEVPAHSLRYLTTAFSYSFTTRSEDIMKPSTILSYPSGTMSKIALDNQAPYVLFSEKVTATVGKNVYFKEGSNTKYTIAASDITCGQAAARAADATVDPPGAVANACLKMDRNKAYFYPLGERATADGGKAAAWATAGQTYTIDIEQGAFSDAATTHVLKNDLDATSFTFVTDEDVSAPTIVSGTPAQAPDAFPLSGNSMFLKFNEIIQNGATNKAAIKAWDFTTAAAAPQLVGGSNGRNGQRQTITLSFDTAVQAGSGNFGLIQYDGTDTTKGSTTAQTAFAGSHVIFKPSTTLSDSTSYYVTGAAGTVKNGASTTTLAAALNTKSSVVVSGPYTTNFTDFSAALQPRWGKAADAWYPNGGGSPDGSTPQGYRASDASGGAYDVENSTDVTLPASVWNTAEDYACIGADGVLPTIVMYMNEEIELLDRRYKIKLFDCGLECDTTSAAPSTDTESWAKFPVDTALSTPPTAAETKSHLVADATQKFKFTMTLSGNTALAQGTRNQIFLEAGMFADYDSGMLNWQTEAGTRRSLGINMQLSVCSVVFNVAGNSGYPNNELRIYSPTTFGPSTTWASRKFTAVVPAGSIKDAHGNTLASELTYASRQESGAPELDPAASNPANGQSGNLKENIVLSFNEVVQAGSGAFQLYDKATDAANDAVKYTVNVASLTGRTGEADGNIIISGKKVSITPKGLCSGTCGKLVDGTTYYLKSGKGAVKDAVGTPVAALNTRSNWYFMGKSATDNKRPAVSFVGGVNGKLATVGYIYFTEQVAQSTASMTIIDCGADFTCGSTGQATETDNVAAITQAAITLTYGDGSTATDYGMLKFAATVPTLNRRYKVTLPNAMVKDVIEAGSSATALQSSSEYSFYMSVGSTPDGDVRSRDQISTGSKPEILKRTPIVDATVVTSSTVTLNFNEDVQAGVMETAAVVKFCSNNNADFAASSPVACTEGKYADGTSSKVDLYNWQSGQKSVTGEANKINVAYDATTNPQGKSLTGAVKTRAECVELVRTQHPTATGASVTEDNEADTTKTCWALLEMTSATDVAGDAAFATVFFEQTVAIDRRTVTITNPKSFKIGQKLYVNMPEGLIRDASTSSTKAAKIEKNMYAFTVADEDTVKPELDYSVLPTLKSGSVTLYFSEAVQASSPLGGANVTETVSNDDVNIVSTYNGNEVTLTASWKAGTAYNLDMTADQFKDLQGNTLSTSPTGSFTINSDASLTASALSPADGTTNNDQNTLLTVTFNELVQKGSGKISIYSGANCKTACTTSTKTLLLEADIASLPLLSYADTTSKSKLVIQTSKLDAGQEYAVRVPSTAVTDLAGNSYTALNSNGDDWGFKVTTEKDSSIMTAANGPSLVTADIAGGGTVNSAFAQGGSLTMYFSEAVQLGTTGSVYLTGYAGTSSCDSNKVACLTGTCSTNCVRPEIAGAATVWSAATDAVSVTSDMSFSGNAVTATVPTLVAGKGYKLEIHKEKFKDTAGVILAADVDGAATAKYILQVAGVNDDSTGPAHTTVLVTDTTTDTINPVVSGEWPAKNPTSNCGTRSGTTAVNAANCVNARMVAPSTTVQVTFNEVVQAGSGEISVGTGMPVSDCHFSGVVMTCDPPGDLARNTDFSVSYSASAIKDAAGNTATTNIGGTASKMEFTTIDLDYVAPVMSAASGVSYAHARRLYTAPYDPQDAATNIASGTVVSLSFSEVVQAGTGMLNVGSKEIDMASHTSNKDIYWSGTTVYVDHGTVLSGTVSVSTSAAGAFLDASSQPLARMSSTYDFKIISDDTINPEVYQYVPKDDAVNANASPSTDITLYFSEAVQAAATKKVTVQDGSNTAVDIKVDNTSPATGSVTVTDNMVVIDPFDDFSYASTVVVKCESNAFEDLFSKQYAGFTGATSYRFKVPAFAFNPMRTSNATTSVMSAREGAIAHWPNASMMVVYGGEKPGSSCTNELFTSATGATWAAVESNGPIVSYAPSAMDGKGCIWLMGGQCSKVMMDSEGGEKAHESAIIYKSCDGAAVWNPIVSPSVMAFNAEGKWPTSFKGHAIAIVGGWQLVVVDSVRGVVYSALDTDAKTMEVANSNAPFAKRHDPMLQSSSANKLFLMGGHNCGDDEEVSGRGLVNCKENKVFTDVWSSGDSGATWECQTANYDAAITETYSRGLGRKASSVITHDDVLWLMGGQKPNTTGGLNTVHTSVDGALDLTFSDVVLSQEPANGAEDLKNDASVAVFFTEDIKAGTLPPTMTDLGDDFTVGGTTANADAAIAATVTFTRQKLSIVPAALLKANHKYTVNIAEGSVLDTAGNSWSTADRSFTIRVSPDITKPTVHQTSSVNDYSPKGTGVESTPNIMIQTSEKVTAGTGSLTLTAPNGDDFSLDVASATLQYSAYSASTKAFFSLAEGQMLTEGQVYTIGLPAGIFVDVKGNQNAKTASVGTFTVNSGSRSSAADGYKGSDFAPAVAGEANVTIDSTAPTFSSAYPPLAATDVPAVNISATLFFNEPVKWNASGLITLKNSSGAVKVTVNVSEECCAACTAKCGNGILTQVKNGAHIDLRQVMPELLNGHTYTVDVPEGVLTDYAGNKAAASAASFTTLAGTPEARKPTVIMSNPAASEPGVLGSITKISLFFSEAIKVGQAGSVTLKKGATSITKTINSVNCTVSGSVMEVTLMPNDLNSAGTWNIIVPADTVTDSQGNQFKGLNATGASATTFAVVLADAVKPTVTLASISPATETSVTYGVVASAAIKLVFSETVVASTGAVTLKPKYTSPAIVVQTGNSDEVFFSGTTMMVSSGSPMMPGEVYTLNVDGEAFTDVQGNKLDAVSTGYTISTSQLIKFSKVAGTHFDDAAYDSQYFDGHRFGAAAAVGPTNDVFVVGGRNGTAGALSTSRLNDVFKLITRREVNCASSFGPDSECSATSCTGSTLGVSTSSRTVWKSPSAAGLKCLDTNNLAVSVIGDVVSDRSASCPCPSCIYSVASTMMGNATMPANIVDDGAYLSVDYAMVSASMGTQELKCMEGYTKSGDFTCVAASAYLGKWLTPHPVCQPNNCSLAAVMASVGGTNTTTSGGMVSGDDITSGSTLTIKCGPGQRVKDSSVSTVTCTNGVIAGEPVCEKGTTTTTTTTTVPEITTTTTTTSLINVTEYTITSSVELTFAALPPGTTLEDAIAEPAFVNNIKEALREQFALNEDAKLDVVISQSGDVTATVAPAAAAATTAAPAAAAATTAAPAAAAAAATTAAPARRLAGMSLTVTYTITTQDEALKNTVVAAVADTSSQEAFSSGFAEKLIKKEAAAGRTIEVSVVAAPAVVAEQTVTIVVTNAPPTIAPVATTTLAVVNTPAATTAAATTAAAAATTAPVGTKAPSGTSKASEDEEEEGSNAGLIGGIIGGVVGLGLIGCLFYMYKNKSAQE